MSTDDDFDLSTLSTLQEVFERIAALEGAKASIAADLTSALEYACVTWGLSKPAVKAAYKWWGMTDGEREDWEQTWEKCKTALRAHNNPDLFSADLEMALESVTITHGERQPKSHANLTRQ